MPFLPLSTIGIAVAFYLGFKNNQAYDRFWEARKIWGGIVNYSRTWGNQVLSYVTLLHAKHTISDKALNEIRRTLLYRQIAWINALRLQLRKPSSFSINYSKSVSKLYKGNPQGEDWKNDVAPFVQADEVEFLKKRKNPATQIIRLQSEQLKQCLESGLIEDFRHIDLMATLEEFYNLQGKSERIKSTPFPRQYAYFGSLFVWIFLILLPFGLVGQFAEMGHTFLWLNIPFYVLIAWIFMTMELVGDNSEDPFENFVNDVPLTAICRTIEIDLRDMLGEKDLPERIKDDDGVLM
jgi:putative membrane protein